MPDCGSEHGKICALMENHEEEIKSMWEVLRSKLSTQVFIWACAIVGVTLGGIIGWLQASNGNIAVLHQQQAIISTKIDHNREVVTNQYIGLKESIEQLKSSISNKD